MIGEIAVVPQTKGPTRELVAEAIDEIARHGLRYQVGATGTSVEGDLDDILAAVRAITEQLADEGVDRAVLELRLQLEPHAETLEHQVEGLGAETRTAVVGARDTAPLGLPEQALREGLSEALLRSMHVEGDRPTVHAIAHSLARVLEQDHLRMAEQLERAGVRLEGPRETTPAVTTPV